MGNPAPPPPTYTLPPPGCGAAIKAVVLISHRWSLSVLRSSLEGDSWALTLLLRVLGEAPTIWGLLSSPAPIPWSSQPPPGIPTGVSKKLTLPWGKGATSWHPVQVAVLLGSSDVLGTCQGLKRNQRSPEHECVRTANVCGPAFFAHVCTQRMCAAVPTHTQWSQPSEGLHVKKEMSKQRRHFCFPPRLAKKVLRAQDLNHKLCEKANGLMRDSCQLGRGPQGNATLS